jgi:hypothetical protein
MSNPAETPLSPTPFDDLSLPEIEEAAGELHRRIGVTLRGIGEARADIPDGEGRSPRWRAASLASETELAATTLACLVAGSTPPFDRTDRHPAAIAAVMYAAPTLPALGLRLEQDRQLLASLARYLDARFEEPRGTAWGELTAHRLVVEVAIVEAARCAQAIELAAATAQI